MAKSLEEMASKGKEKLDRKSTSMAKNFNDSKTKAKKNFGEQPFGPQTTENYNKGMDAAVYVQPDTDEWKESWMAAMRK